MASTTVAPLTPMPLQGTRRLPGSLGLVFDLFGLALITLFLMGLIERNVTHQGDLKTYRLAARAALDGLDPYRPEDLASVAGQRVFPFVYPPVALLPFVATANLSGKTVAVLWIWGKVVLLAALVFAWARWFVPGVRLLPIALLAAFGWNASAQWDLATGNVALLECGLIWAAFACFVAGWRTRFALLMVAAACFKLMPAAFLLLLLVPTDRGEASPKRFVAALVLLALVIIGPTLIGPAAHYRPFWANVPDATSYGTSNPSALGLANVLAQAVGFEGESGSRVALALWGAYALGLIACSLPMLRRVHRLRDPRLWVMSAVFLYVLLLPRPMAYGFALLAPAPLFFSPRPFHRPAGQLLLALLLSSQGLLRLNSISTGSPIVTYAPFLLSLCVWLLVVNERSSTAMEPAMSVAS